jgi:DNA-binding CsgD family transcriptional regulator
MTAGSGSASKPGETPPIDFGPGSGWIRRVKRDTELWIRGRDDVLEKLRVLLEDVREDPVAILLEGVAGIGKTAVWTVGVGMAEAHGYRVLRSRPVRAEARLAFAGLGDLLAAVDEAELASLPRAQGDAIDAALLRSDRATADHRAVAVAVAGLLHAMAVVRPVIVAIDDVQWLDAPTRRVLEFVARRLDRAQVGFLLAQRRELDTPAAGRSGMQRVFENLRHERISLGPLMADDLVQVLRSEPEIDLPKLTLDQVVQASGGNPLYALEFARGLRGEHVLAPGEPLPIPDSLRGVVRQRLQPLDPGTRQALLLLALLARPHADVVARALTHAGASLHMAREAGLVEDDGEDVRFTHPLLASAVIDEADSDDRRAAHRHLAEVVDDVEARARHLALSADGDDEIVASELEAAAKAARARGAPEAAAEMLELAASLTPASRLEERHRLTIAAAEDLFDAGEVRHVRELLEGLVAVLEPGPPRAQALSLLASVRFTSDSASDAYVLAEQALTEAQGNAGLTMSLEFIAALTLITIGDHNLAREHLASAREIACQLAITEAIEATRVFELMFKSPLDTDYDAWVDIEHVTLPGGKDYFRANRLIWEGALDEARVVLEAMRTDVLAAGDDASLPVVLQMLMRLETWSGHLDRARTYGAEGVAITEVTGRDALRAVVLSVSFHAHALQDPEAEVRAAITRGIALAERTGALSVIPDMQWAHGVLDLSTGAVESAASRLGDGRERMLAMGVDHPGALRFLVDEVDALLACGRLDEAECRLALFPTSGRAGEVPWIRAAHARARGLVAASRGAPEAAVEQLTLALEVLETTPMRLDLARTLLADGRVRRRSKQWGSARRSLTEALVLFEEMGAPHWAAAARAELGRVGGRPPSGDELTAIEQRVAALVATGRTNREVADELFLSPQTVAWHLRRIYRKLGVRNRVELGAIVARTTAG